MLQATAYLSAGLFFALLVIYIYRQKYGAKKRKAQQVSVPLRVDRKALLDQKRLAVADRRGNLKSFRTTTKHQPPTNKTDDKIENSSEDVTTDAIDDGFAEDLGVALTMNQKLDNPRQDQRTGQSRFSALKDAAAELRDVYSKNNSI